MAFTESNMLELNSFAPEFNLFDTISNQYVSYADIQGAQATVVMFICNHCPFVVHVNDELVSIAEHYNKKGVGFVAISSNDAISYPQDGPEQMSIVAKVLKYPFPYLYDETQKVAQDYMAACTPDFYLFNKENRLVYRGRLDSSRPANGDPLTGANLRSAIDAVLLGVDDISPQFPSAGCNIKWKST